MTSDDYKRDSRQVGTFGEWLVMMALLQAYPEDQIRVDRLDAIGIDVALYHPEVNLGISVKTRNRILWDKKTKKNPGLKLEPNDMQSCCKEAKARVLEPAIGLVVMDDDCMDVLVVHVGIFLKRYGRLWWIGEEDDPGAVNYSHTLSLALSRKQRDMWATSFDDVILFQRYDRREPVI
ncbi:hypothetical protein [Actinomyces vulturis]|uniref:hypothetical protein n=1 Tax=Actinomyces vulturis TaxID=1857645 RepID=UPI000835B28B|nr:hypothetical protein [Actinomyces vulturis]